jgi:hypothetical protein
MKDKKHFAFLRFFIFYICLLFPFLGKAQLRQTQFNGFGHLEFTLDKDEEGRHASFVMGEHDFFVNSSLSDKITFIGEYVIRFNGKSATNYLPSIERSLVKFNYVNNHSIIVGKVHTPVNYWNDVYHHGRVFFPVIDRPMSFSYFVPLHTMGLQFQGQNLGNLNFGYDFMIGNGISSTDAFHDSVVPSITGSVHIRPKEGMRIGLSYYWDDLHDNTPGLHSGHNTASVIPDAKKYQGPVKFRLASFSFAQFGEKFEFLNETGFNASTTDSTGTSKNFSQFVYAGLNLTEKSTPYVLFDYIDVADNDIHVYPLEKLKIAVGYRYSFNYLLNLKVQLERNWEFERFGRAHGSLTYGGPFLRVQLAYGF